MATVELTNISKTTFVFTLYHGIYCDDESECDCKIDDVLRSVAGGLKYSKITTPNAIYLEPGVTVKLDKAALNIPQVIEAGKRGILKVKVEETVETLDPSRRT